MTTTPEARDGRAEHAHSAEHYAGKAAAQNMMVAGLITVLMALAVLAAILIADALGTPS